VQCGIVAFLNRLNVLYLNHRNDAGPIEVADVRKPSGKGIIMNVARSFNNWRKFRQTVAELDRMSSRELQDLGIARADIRSVARAAMGR